MGIYERLWVAAGEVELALKVIPLNHPGVKQHVLDAAKLAGEALREFPDVRDDIASVPQHLAPATASEQRAIKRLRELSKQSFHFWEETMLLEIVRAVRGEIK